MKKLFSIILLFSTITTFGQKVEIDKFTQNKRIESSKEFLMTGLSGYMRMYFRSNGTTVLIELEGDKFAGVVGTTDKFIFLFSDSSTVTIYPTSIQTTEGYGTNERYYHTYKSSISDIKSIAEKTIVSIRRYYSSNYGDLDIKEKKAKKISEAAKWFITEFEK